MSRPERQDDRFVPEGDLDDRAVGRIARWVALGALLGAAVGAVKAKGWWLFGWDLDVALAKWLVFGLVLGGFLSGVVAIGVAQRAAARRSARPGQQR